MLIDMGKYLDEYDPNYRALSPESVQQWGFYNGGEYAIAQQRFAPSVVSNVLYVRQDWLDKLGMGISTTEEEFLEVLCAFTEDDPDGNGVNDTYGWCMTTAAKTTLHAVNKSSDRWYKQEDGTFQYRDMSGAKMKTIQMMEKIIDNGWCSKEL